MEETPVFSGQAWPHTCTCFHILGSQTAGSTLRGFGKSPQFVPLFTSGNLCGREWDLLLCKELIQPLQDDSHSRHTLDSLHANTYPEPSAGSGPWSFGCSRRSPSASLWVVRIASAHLQGKHSPSLEHIPTAARGACGQSWEQTLLLLLPLEGADSGRNPNFTCCCRLKRECDTCSPFFLRVGLTQRTRLFLTNILQQNKLAEMSTFIFSPHYPYPCVVNYLPQAIKKSWRAITVCTPLVQHLGWIEFDGERGGVGIKRCGVPLFLLSCESCGYRGLTESQSRPGAAPK